MNENLALLAAVAKLTPNLTKPAPGTHRVKGFLTLEVDATITKGEPNSYVPTVALPLKSILAIALRKAGVQAKNIERIVVEAATEALAFGDKVDLEATERGLEAVKGMLAKLPLKVREGSTRVDGTARVVEYRNAEALVSAA